MSIEKSVRAPRLQALLCGIFLVLAAFSSAAQTPVQGFVTRSGSHLLLNGSTFRFSGANAEWLGSPDGTTPFQVQDGISTMHEMGATAARSLWLTSIGTSDALQTARGVYNDAAFRRIDYIVKVAGDYGIRLIIPLSDYDANGDGSIAYYTQWRGISDQSQFFTNSTVISDFEAFISTYLNHVNVFTGVANKNNPTILAWETGNELQNVPSTWTDTIAQYIKSIDSNHLVASGACQFTGSGSCTYPSGDLSIASVDIVTDHFYPMSVSQLQSHASAAASSSKVYYVGEYDWAAYEVNSSTLSDFLSALESSSGVSGDLFWQLFEHRDNGGYKQYRYAGQFGLALGLHYPGDTSDMKSRVTLLRNHAYVDQGLSTPPAQDTPPRPFLLWASGATLTWRGSVGAASYTIDRSTAGTGGPWTTICNQCVSDFTGFYVDSSQPTSGNLAYRITPVGVNGATGPVSLPVAAYPVSTIADAGFESPTTSTYTSAPTGGPWTFSSSAGVSANGSAFTNTNPSAPEGSQVAFIQGTATISATVNLPTNTLACVAVAAAQRNNYNNGGQDFQIKIDNVNLGTIKPVEADYVLYLSIPFNVATPTHTLSFVGLNTAGGDNTAFLDSVGIVPNCQPGFLNASFETPGLASQQFQAIKTTSDAGWTIFGGGISANGSGYTSGNPSAPNGSQVGFLQGAYAFAGQALPNLIPATNYCLTFSAAQRGNYNQGGQDVQLYVDYLPVGSVIKPTSTNYAASTIGPFQLTGSPSTLHNFYLLGNDTSGGDNTLLVDNVLLSTCN